MSRFPQNSTELRPTVKTRERCAALRGTARKTGTREGRLRGRFVRMRVFRVLQSAKLHRARVGGAWYRARTATGKDGNKAVK